MSIHRHPDKRFLDDKDAFDLLSASSITRNQTLQLFARKGVFLPSGASDDRLARIASSIPLDWYGAKDLLDLASREERQLPLGIMKIRDCSVTKGKIMEVIKDVKGARSHSEKEEYSQYKHGESGVRVEVRYRIIDPSRTRALQHTEKEVSILIINKGSSVEIRFSNNERGATIAGAIRSRISKASGGENKLLEIDLSGITTAGERTQFFTKLMRGINGYSLIDVTKVRLNKMPKTVQHDDDGVGDDPQGEDLEDQLKQALLSGKRLLTSRLYHHLSQSDFYISDVKWKCECDQDPRETIECTADFTESDDGTGFKYAITAKYVEDEAGRPVRESMSAIERDEYNSLIEISAFSAMEEIQQAITEDDK